MNEKKWALWLDDLRNPYTSEKRSLHPIGKTFVWARDVEQAIYFVKAFGPPDYMALDHDLGLDEENTRIQNSLVYKESGMDFLKWLEEHMDGRRPPDAIVHSDNPEGKKNMEAFIRSWSRSASNEENGNYFTVFSNPGPALSGPPLEMDQDSWFPDSDEINTEYINDRSQKDKSPGELVVEMAKKEIFVPAFAKREMKKDDQELKLEPKTKHRARQAVTQFAAGKKMRARQIRETLGPTGFRDGEVRSAIAWLWDRGYLNVEVDQTITILKQYEPSV